MSEPLDTDGSHNAIHHTLGFGANQASPGNHSHDGGTSTDLILTGPVGPQGIQGEPGIDGTGGGSGSDTGWILVPDFNTSVAWGGGIKVRKINGIVYMNRAYWVVNPSYTWQHAQMGDASYLRLGTLAEEFQPEDDINTLFSYSNNNLTYIERGYISSWNGEIFVLNSTPSDIILSPDENNIDFVFSTTTSWIAQVP